MPTYEYKCDNCGHEFEKFQSIKAGAIRKCPACGKMKVRRLISTGGGVIFKGSGFYETDYRRSSYKKDAEKDKETNTGKGDKKGKKEDSKKSDKAGGEKGKGSSSAKGSKKEK